MSKSGIQSSNGLLDFGGGADISGKADKVTSATNGHLAGLDSNGNLTDSGKSSSAVIPSGGTTGQVLKKSSGTDYAVEWGTVSSGGHTILNGSGSAMTARSKLQLEGGAVKDDSSNDKTVFTVAKELTQAQYDALSSAEKNNGTTYYITDAPSSYTGVPQSMIGDAWVLGHAYAVGDYAIDANGLYKNGTAHTSTATNRPSVNQSRYWTLKSVAGEITDRLSVKQLTNFNVNNNFTKTAGSVVRVGNVVTIAITIKANSNITLALNTELVTGLPNAYGANYTILLIDVAGNKLYTGRMGSGKIHSNTTNTIAKDTLLEVSGTYICY